MRKVIITKGTYGYQPEGENFVRPVSRRDGAIELPDEEAERLISLRVAEYYVDPAEDTPDNGVATGGSGKNGDSVGDNTPDNDRGAKSGENALTKPEYNAETNANTLKALMKVCGLTVKVGLTKPKMVEALDAYYNAKTVSGDTDSKNDGHEADSCEDGDGDDKPPELGAEEPVT